MIERGAKPDAVRVSDGAFFKAGSGPDPFASLFDPTANCYYFIGVSPVKTWYGVRWEQTGEIWEFSDHKLFDCPSPEEWKSLIHEALRTPREVAPS